MLVSSSELEDTYKISNKRAGVIVYTMYEGRLYFLLGVDRKTGEYTDFGGGCKNNEKLLDGAWREFQEESCGIFSKLTQISKDSLHDSFAVVSKKKDFCIFFLEAPTALLEIAPPLFKHVQKKIDPTTKSTSFQVLEAKSQSKSMENISIEWVDDETFEDIIFNSENNYMWSRVKKFLSKNMDYSSLKLKIALKRAITIPDKRKSFMPMSCPSFSDRFLTDHAVSL